MNEVRNSYVAGLDLGRSKDPSVLSILECRTTRAIPMSLHMWQRTTLPETLLNTSVSRIYILKTLKRWPLGSSYVKVAEEVKTILSATTFSPNGWHQEADRKIPIICAGTPPSLVTDATGIGQAVVDYLNAIGLRPFPLTLTSGEQQHYTNVPKPDVVHGLLMLIQSGKFKIAKNLALLNTFAKEMANFRASSTPSGRTSYSAVSGHDDCVMSVGIAAWYAEAEAKKPVFIADRAVNIYAR